MDQNLKQRIIGAIILTALAVIFVPMLFEEPVESVESVKDLDLPEFPKEFESRVMPLATGPENIEPSGQEKDSFSGLAEPAPASAEPAQKPVEEAEKPADPPGKETRPSAAADAAKSKSVEQVLKKTVETVDAEPLQKAIPPKPQPAGGDAWVVQVGSFAQEINALIFRDKLRKNGYTAFVEPAKNEDQGTFYRVKVGPELGRTRAKSIRDKIAEDLGVKGWIVAAE